MQLIQSVLKSREARRERFVLPRRLAAGAGASLEPVADRTSAIRRWGVLACVPLTDDAPLLPAALAHHRRLGVDHFLVVDASGGRADAAASLVADAPDCSLWRLPVPAGDAAIRHAFNDLRFRHGCGIWCLSLPANCLLVYPRYETRVLCDLLEFLGSEGRETLYAVTLDMYRPSDAGEADYRPGDDPLRVAGYFDAVGYVQVPDASYGDTRIQGGPSRRITARNAPWTAPPIDAIPLVRWRKDYNYLEGTRLLAPRRLNRPHSRWHVSPTGCLLRFSGLGKARGDEGEPAATGAPCMFDESVAFTGSETLLRLGLMSQGQWF